MKALLKCLMLLAAAKASAGEIIFQQTTTTTTTVVLSGGLNVHRGNMDFVRRFVNMTQGTVGIGSQVITSDDRDGAVSAIFVDNNKIIVSDSFYGNRTWNLNQVAVTTGCSDGLCVGDTVITSDDRDGVLSGIFNDGSMVVRDSFYGNRTWQSSQVAAAFGCTASFCTGDAVVTSDDRSGIVAGFFPNGQVTVRDSFYGNRTWQSGSIAMTTAICANIYIQRSFYCH